MDTSELIGTWQHDGLYTNSKPFRLELYDSGKRNPHTGRYYIGYKFYHDDNLIFSGEDFSPSPLHAIDGDESIASLLSFLSLQPGDTDDEYFDDYMPEQMEWCQQYGEELSWLAMELEEELT